MNEKQELAADEILDCATQAQKSGHYAAARALLAQAQDTSGPLAERRKALWARFSPDPFVLWLIGLCLLLFVTIIFLTAA